MGERTSRSDTDLLIFGSSVNLTEIRQRSGDTARSVFVAFTHPYMFGFDLFYLILKHYFAKDAILKEDCFVM